MADIMMSKAEVTTLLARGRAAVETWMAGLSEGQRAAPASLQRWGAKGTLAHIAHWNLRLLAALDLKARGGPVPWQWEDMDGQNARLLEQMGARTWDEVAGEAADAYAVLLDRLDRLSEQDLQAPDDFAWQSGGALWGTFVGNAYFHPLVHLAEFYTECGCPDQAAALRAEIDEADEKGLAL